MVKKVRKKRRLVKKKAKRATISMCGLRFEIQFDCRPEDDPFGVLYGPDGGPWFHISLKDVIEGRAILTGGNNNAFITAMGKAVK